MIEAIKTVKNALQKNGDLPELIHFYIKDGHILAYNGVTAISAPIDVKFNAAPAGQLFFKAIAKCNNDDFTMKKVSDHILITSGKLKVKVPCIPDSDLATLPTLDTGGVVLDLPNGYPLLDILETMTQFVSDDKSKPFANGIMFKGYSCFATDNIVLAEYYSGVFFPKTMNLPAEAIREILRIGKSPVEIIATESTVRFVFDDGSWVMSKLIVHPFPEMENLLNKFDYSNNSELDQCVFDDVLKISDFTDDLNVITFEDNEIKSRDAIIETKQKGMTGRYSAKRFLQLKGVARYMNFNNYPNPATFTNGKNVRGVIVGMTQNSV